MAHEQVASEKQQMRCQGDQGHGFEKRFWVQEEREIKTRAPDLFKEEMTGLYIESEGGNREGGNREGEQIN